MTRTITAANAIYALGIPGLYDVPQILQGYSADAAFDTDPSTAAEIVMGVDGIMSSGFVPFVVEQTISLMPNSPSSDIFENWLEAQKTLRENLPAFASIALPSVQRKYNCQNGVLMSVVQIPGTRKVLQARSFRIAWNNISPAPFG